MTKCDDSQWCHELLGEKEGVAFYQIYEEDPLTRIVAESKNFALIADISPLAEGHTLLVPMAHYINFGRVPRVLWDELSAFRQYCIKLIGAAYDEPTILEHGSCSAMCNSSCISHAHWHLVPHASAILEIFHADGLVGEHMPSWITLSQMAQVDDPYIYYSYRNTHQIFRRDLSKRRQYLRMAMGKLFSIPDPEWDWMFQGRREWLRNTVATLRK